MARLFPSRTDPTIKRDDEPSVLYVDQAQTEDVFDTLSSETARTIFRMLNERALSASEIADELDLSVQNASYHLTNLREANLVEVIDTCYSEKGREMEIYAVTPDPKVLILGVEADSANLRQAFRHLAESIGLPAVAIAGFGTAARLVDGLLEA